MNARVSQRQRAVLLIAVFGLFGFKGDACLCGSGHRPPPRHESQEPQPSTDRSDASTAE